MTKRPTAFPDWLKGAEQHSEMWPTGHSELDWDLARLPTEPLFNPEIHVGPERLSDIPDIFGPLRRVKDGRQGTTVLVEAERFERLAWYRSFRSGDSWGIYIREAAVAMLADRIASPARPSGPESEFVAWSVFYLHEYAHFLFDVAARSLEEVTGSPVYIPFGKEIAATSLGWHREEEAICNAFAYARAPSVGYKRRLRDFMRNQPLGYDEFEQFSVGDRFDIGVETVLGQMLRGLDGRSGRGLRPLFDDSGAARVLPAMVPVHVVYERDLAPMFHLIACLGSVESTKKFDKQLDGLPIRTRQSWLEQELPALLSDVRMASKFKRLKGDRDLFSVRVGGNHRAILRREGDGQWTAEQISHRKDVYK